MPEASVLTADRLAPLPVGPTARRGVGWWGMLCLIATEAALFVYLLFSYFYVALQNDGGWLPEAHPSVRLALPNTIVLLLSSVAMWQGDRGVRRGARGQLIGGVLVALALGTVFVAVQLFEWRAKTYSIQSHSYGSLYFTITGFHMAHVVVGLAMLLTVLVWSALGYFNRRRSAPVLIASAYWHFVDAVWLFVFAAFYLSPYAMG